MRTKVPPEFVTHAATTFADPDWQVVLNLAVLILIVIVFVAVALELSAIELLEIKVPLDTGVELERELTLDVPTAELVGVALEVPVVEDDRDANDEERGIIEDVAVDEPLSVLEVPSMLLDVEL